jgi:hypothetical protein
MGRRSLLCFTIVQLLFPMDVPALWSGVILVSGLSDSYSDKWARMRVVLFNGVLYGGYAGEAEASTVVVPRLLLLGTSILDSGVDDEVRIHSAEGLSREVGLRPCGEPANRAAFRIALREAAARAPCLSGLVLLSLSNASPSEATPCIVTLTSNKHRAVFKIEPVRVSGLCAGEDAVDGKNESEVDGSSEGNASPADVYAKVVPSDEFGGGFYVKVAGEGVETGVNGEGATIGVRLIARVRLFLGLINYKRSGIAQTMAVRALDLGSRDIALLSPPPPRRPSSWFSSAPAGTDAASVEANSNKVRVLSPAQLAAGCEALRLLFEGISKTKALVVPAAARAPISSNVTRGDDDVGEVEVQDDAAASNTALLFKNASVAIEAAAETELPPSPQPPALEESDDSGDDETPDATDGKGSPTAPQLPQN